jgi:hypothetical protein
VAGHERRRRARRQHLNAFAAARRVKPDSTQMQERGQVMLIRVVTTRADAPRTAEGIAFVHGEIQPKIAAMDGNTGFAMAADRSSESYVSIAAWTDAEALAASGHKFQQLVPAWFEHYDGLAAIMGAEPGPELACRCSAACFTAGRSDPPEMLH